jgi:hypothetical protein
MATRLPSLITLIAALSVAATAQQLTAREYAKAHGIPNRQSAITLGPPHACTLSKDHPCVYYGGDIDPNDPEETGLSNENDLAIGTPSWTYTEITVPVASIRVSAAFTNNLQTYGIIDPQTANWDFRIGVHEYYGGISIGSGTSAALLTDTGRNYLGLEEYELLTRASVALPKGDLWFDVQPNCTNQSDPDCVNSGRYFESDTDGLNGINSKFTVTSNTGMGPTWYCEPNGLCEPPVWVSWCKDEGAACGDGMSAGLLK